MHADTIRGHLTQPILATLLEQRSMAVAIAGAALVHGGLSWVGLPSWQCPIRHTLGLPCPGCGLSRAIAALLAGDWAASVNYHAFAPLFLAALLLIGLAACLPDRHRRWVSQLVGNLERRTGLTALLLIGLVGYWLGRLLFFHDDFVRLIMG